MASTKNSDRRKRKYGEKQKARTDQNKRSKQKRHDHKQAKLVDRTQKLLGKQVEVRVPGNIKPLVGTVTEVIRQTDEKYPKDAERHNGAYLKVRTNTNAGDVVKSRHRIKPR